MRGAFSFSGSTVQRSLTLCTSFSTIGVEGDIHVSTSSVGFHPPYPHQWPRSCALKPGLIRFFFHLEQYFSLTNSSRFIQIPPSERSLAVVRRLEEPPLCECGDRAVINPQNTLEFMCPNKHEVSGKCIYLNV